MDTYILMKEALYPLDLYSFDDTKISYELMAYSVVFDELNNELCTMLSERFVQSASSYGLSEREIVVGAQREDLNIEERREMLMLRNSLDNNSFTLSKIKNALKSFGLSCNVYEYPNQFVIVLDAIGTYKSEQQAWIRAEVQKIMPAHLQVQVIFGGPSWDTIDQNNNTYAYLDSLDMTWDSIDNLE